MKRLYKSSVLAVALAKRWEEYAGKSFPGGPENASIQRTRSGRWQRAAGAWRWFIVLINDSPDWPYGTEIFGSQYPARQVAKAKDLDWYSPPWGGLEVSPKG